MTISRVSNPAPDASVPRQPPSGTYYIGEQADAPKPTGGDEERARAIYAQMCSHFAMMPSVAGDPSKHIAAALAAQATQIAALREALEPFGGVGEAIDATKFGNILFGDSERAFRKSECGCRWMVDGEPRELTWLHFRRARAALEMSGGAR